MYNKYVTIGIANSDISYVKCELEKLLKIFFDEHESSYKGKYFLYKKNNSEKIEFGTNYQDGVWREAEYKDYLILLELNGFEEIAQLTNKILEDINDSLFIKAIEIEPGVSVRVYNFVSGDFKLVSEKNLKKR